MDTSSNIKFNVEGDDKFTQFLEKTQKSMKEMGEKTIKLFTQGFKNSSSEITVNQKVVGKLLGEYENLSKSTLTLNKATKDLTKTVGLSFAAFSLYTNVTQYKVYFDTVLGGLFEIKNALETTNRGLNLMAASGYDATPLVNSFNEIGAVITGNTQAIEQFATKSTIAYNSFEQKLNEVNIVFGLSQERLSEYGDALQNGLEKNLKNSVSSLTALNAAYQAASAGFTDFQNNQDVVNLAIKANKAAPGSDLFQIGGALGKGAGILNTRDVKELEVVTAKWLATEQLGLTTVGDMTEYISDMYSSLKNAGIGTKDLVNETQGLVVAFTKLGGKVTDISTEMQAFARNTIGKTPEAMKALEGLVDAQGKAITLNQEYFGRKGVVQGIVDFAEAVGYNTEKIKEVYNETNAFNFAMKVLAQNGNLAKKSIEDISKVTSENLTDAFESATKSSQAKMEQITNSYDEIMISFGKAFKKRSEEGVESVETYKELLVTFKEPLIQIAEKSVAFFDTLNKITGVLGAIGKTFISIVGTLLSFRAFGLVLGGLTNGFKDLRKESGIIKDLYTSNQGLVAVGKQILGIDQQRLLSQDRINKAIANSTDLEKELVNSIGKTNSERATSISAVQKEIDAIVARDTSIIKSQEKVKKVEESLRKKQDKSKTLESQVSETESKVSNTKNLKKTIDTKLEDDIENVERFKKLEELNAKEALIRQKKIGEAEKAQLKQINTEKLRLQTTYSKTTLKELEELEKQKNLIKNKSNKSEEDFVELAKFRSKELEILATEKEKQKNRAPLSDREKSNLSNASADLTNKIDQEELVLLTQRQKLQEANNLVDKESEKLNSAKVKQTENLNRVTQATTELAILQQDLNTKKTVADRVDIAAKGQQERLYQVQNNLRKEQATLDKVRNKDSAEYQQQLKKVIALQEQEANQQIAVQKANTINQQARKDANKAEKDANIKLRELTREQGLAEGSLIELQTRSGAVAFKNTGFNRGLIASYEGLGKGLNSLKTPVKTFNNAIEGVRNSFVDLRSNVGGLNASLTRNFDNMAASAKSKFAAIANAAGLSAESIKAAFISTGVGLLIAGATALLAKFIEVESASRKLDETYKEFNITLEESATKFDRANISFDNTIQGLNKFSDRVEAASKLQAGLEPTLWDSIGNSIKNAGKALLDFVDIGGVLTKNLPTIWNSFSDAEFIKRTAKMTQISDFIQTYELALRGQNKELAKGNLLTETSNQKIKAKMILTGEDLEREKAANKTRIESFTEMLETQKKGLDDLKNKGDKLTDAEKLQIPLLEAEISRREKVIEVSKKQFEEQLKYYEARNLLLDRENKFSNTQVSLEEIKSLQNQVNSAQTTLNTNISEGLDIYSSSIKDSSTKSKQFLSDLKDGSLSVKATLKGLGGEIYKVDKDGKVLSKLPDTVLKSIETVLKGQEIDGKKYSLEQVLGLKETRDALTEAGVEIPKDLSVLANKMRKSYEESEGKIKLINLKDLEKDLANFSVLSDKYQEKKRQFLSTTKDDVGATQFSTSLKKSLRLAETDLQSFLNALDSSSKGLNTYVTASTQKFTEQALNGTLDLTEGLKELGKVESEIDSKQLEKLKLAITGKNKDEILVALKAIGVETEKALTADSIDLNKFEANLGGFIESLNAVAESGEATSEEVAKKFENVYDQMKGKVTPAAYKDLTETLISYEKAASEQRISYIGMETSALEQQKKYGFLLETDYIEQINKLNIQTSEENIKNKKIELKRLLTLYKESAPQVVKAKAELDALELNLSSQKSSNPVEIAQAQSKAKFDILKKDLELGKITRRQYIEEELDDTGKLYKTQLTEKQKTLAELMKDEVKNAKAIKALRKSMESDEKDYNLSILEINRKRIEEQFKLQTNALGKRELATRESAINGTTTKELESARKLETDKIALNIKTLEARLAIEKKGSEKFIEIEKQLLEAQVSLKEVRVKQDKDKVNENIENKKRELSILFALEERNNLKGSTSEDLEKSRKLRETETQLTINSIKSQISLTEKGSKERLALEAQLVSEITKLQKTQLENEKERANERIEDKKRELSKIADLQTRASLDGNTEKELANNRKLKEKEIQLTISSIKDQIKFTKEGSKQRLALELSLQQEITKLQKQQIDNQKETLETQLDLNRKAIEDKATLLEKQSITGSNNQQLEASRKLKEEEIKNTVDSLKQRSALYEKGSKERIEIERQIVKELNNLAKTEFENRKNRLETALEDKRRSLETKQIALEKESIRGTTEQDIEKDRQLKEQDITNTINSLKEKSTLFAKGSRERIALEQEIARETLKLDKQVYENQKSRLQLQIDNRRKAFKDSQLQLEKLLVLGTSTEDSKKVRASKEQEILLNAEAIKQEINLTKAGSIQRKDLERSLKEELLKLDKQRVTNKRELMDEEIELEKTKITKIQSLLERSSIGGTFEEDLDKIRELKVKETQVVIQSIQKQLATYKLGSKERLNLEATLTQEITKLQKIQFGNKKEKLEAQLEESKNKLDKQVALKESALIDGATERELKIVEESKLKETQLTIDSIKEQMTLYKEGSKERLALEANLQREINNLRKQTLDKEKNAIQTNLEFKKVKIDIDNIELEKKLLSGDINREAFEDKLTASSQKVNLLQQEAFTKQLKLYQKGSREYLDILKNLSQLQVDYQKSVVDKAIRDIDRLTKSQNNSIEEQKQSITRQLNSSDSLTKELQEQIKLEDSRNSVIKASSDYQVGLLELTKRSTGDIEKRAKIDVQIAEMKQKSLLESQQLEINSIKNNALINEAALEREKIQISLNRLELDRSKIQTEAELRKAKLNKLDQASIGALQLQLSSINEQYTNLSRSENLISTQIANQAEISNNQLKVVKQQQDLAQKNSALDVEQAKQGLIIAGYEKQLSQLKMKGVLIESNANKEKVIGDLLTKAYDTQISLLNSRKELMDSTLSSIDTLYGIEQSMAKSELTKDKLAREQAKDKLTFLDLQQRMENESFNLEKAKNKIVRERQKVELTIAEINSKQALAMAKVEEARTNARKDATEEEKLAAQLAVESAEQGILAAKANKELAIEVSKIEEQSEKNKELINARNQRNQRLQAEMAVAQTTTNTADDAQVSGKAQRYRELDELNSRNLFSNKDSLESSSKINKILKDFTESIDLKELGSSPIVKLLPNTVDVKPQNNIVNQKQLLESIRNYQLSVDKTNLEKKKEEDIRHRENIRGSNKLQETMESLVGVMEEYAKNGGNTTLNAPITVQGGDKNVAVDITKHLYDLTSKVERRQNSSSKGWSMR